jgi:hypothetical protein
MNPCNLVYYPTIFSAQLVYCYNLHATFHNLQAETSRPYSLSMI